MNIHINPKFKSLIPPLAADEYKGLEESILSEGCRDALVLWNDTLIDGHNRYEICTKHGIDFKTIQKEFDSEDDALLWIIDNQLAKRNLDKWGKLDLAEKKEEILARQAKQRMSDGGKGKEIFPDLKGQTRDKMGELIGVSGRTYDKMKTINNEAPPEIRAMARSGEISTDKAYLITKGITDKSPAQAKKELYEKADAEREEFKNSKVVSFDNIKKDKENRKILARDLYSRCLRMGTNISEITIIEKETNISIEEMTKELSASEVESLRQKIKWWINTLSQIERRL